MASQKTYKIQFPDGSFSLGGSPPRRGRDGKTWSSLGAVRSHITMVTQSWAGHVCAPKYAPLAPHPYEGAKLVSFVQVPSDTTDINVSESVEKHVKDSGKNPYNASRPDEFAEWRRTVRSFLKGGKE